MNHFSSQLLFLILCLGAGWWVNRHNFNGYMRNVNGIPVPSYIIAAAVSVFIGLVLWGSINLLLLKFR